MSQRTRILFVSHEGTRTGAPMMLLHFIRWLREHSTVDPEIAIIRGGPLTEEFAELGPTTVLGDVVDWPIPSTAEKRLQRRAPRAAFALQRARVRATVRDLHGPSIAYLNSGASIRLLHHLPHIRTSIAHVHELASSLPWSLRPQDPPLLHDRIDHVVAAADCVAESLVQRYRISRDRLSRVYEFIDTDAVVAPPVRSRTEIRAELGLPEDALVVGGSGWADWRKGIDLFIQLARSVVRSGRRDVHFVWVGGLPGGFEWEQIAMDIAHSGAEAHLHLVGLRDRPFDWYRTFDVFALTSREDPYPLVGLETALLQVPMLVFEDSGGMIELLRRDHVATGELGVIVPYLDVEAMADAALALLDDPGRRSSIGQRIGAVVQRDHDVDVAAPQLLEVIERATGRSLC